MGGWWDNEPGTLQELSIKQCVKCITAFADKRPLDEGDRLKYTYTLKPGLIMPTEICNSLVDGYLRHRIYPRTGEDSNRVEITDAIERFLNIFSNPEVTHLTRVNLRNLPANNSIVRAVLHHKLCELTLPSKCNDVLDDINKHGEHLLYLDLGSATEILCRVYEDAQDNLGYIHVTDYTLNCPELRVLKMHHLNDDESHDLLEIMFRTLKNLSHLDLSYSDTRYWNSMDFLRLLTHLTSLVLYNVTLRKEDDIQCIGQCKNLRHLDLSHGRANHETGMATYWYSDSNSLLVREVIQNLPVLDSLDLSNTNIAGQTPVQLSASNSIQLRQATKATLTNSHSKPPPDGSGDSVQCPIPWLNGRQFEFLGLLDCYEDVCIRDHLPAKKVAGSANEDQILTAVTAFLDKPELLNTALNYLLNLLEENKLVDHRRALLAVLNALEKHLVSKLILISSSAILFYIVKGPEKENMPIKLKRRILTTMLDGVSFHHTVPVGLRNVLLTICNFKIPGDVMFMYERLIHFIVKNVLSIQQESTIKGIGVHLLNILACSVDHNEKVILGKRRVIEKMIEIINSHLLQETYDVVVETAWSALWNVTDETEKNCELFVKNKGLASFWRCLQIFPDKENLLRNMMGLMGNIAEIASLRPYMMETRFIELFRNLLSSTADGIEVSYNASGVLSHIASDGDNAWTIKTPRKEDVMEQVKQAADKWDINSERNMNYRSFNPILRLLHCYHTPQVMHWAVWALANLTKVYPHKYCALLIQEGGIPLLKRILEDPAPYKQIKDLASQVLQQCEEVDLDGVEEVSQPHIDGADNGFYPLGDIYN